MTKKLCACPYLGKRFLAIFGPIGLKFVMGAQEIIIYRLIKRSKRFDTLGKKGRGHHPSTRAPNGLGPPNPRLKSWPTGRTF